MKDTAGNCSLHRAEGKYQTGKAVADSNFLLVWMYVSNKGSYRITTDTTNGYSFSATGRFADTEAVQIKLPASEVPVREGIDLFTVRYDSTFCRIAVTVQPAPIPVSTSNPDYFPLTPGSRWVYDDLIFPGDSVVASVMKDTTIGPYSYKRVDEYRSFYPATNSRYFVKQAFDYFRYASVSNFTSAFNFSPSIYDHLNFLKEGLASNFTWLSPLYSGRTTLSARVKDLMYSFKCVNADTSVVVNNKLFNKVYKIQMIPHAADGGMPPQPTGEVRTLYFAKGVGLIYQEFFNGVLLHGELAIRNWMVN